MYEVLYKVIRQRRRGAEKDIMVAYQRPTNNPQLLTLHYEIFNGLFG